MKQDPQAARTDQRKERVIVAGLVLLVAGVVAAAAVWAVQSMQVAQAAKKQVAQRKAANARLDLPGDYPSDFLPVYDGATIVSSEQGDVKSTEGAEMDQWKIHAETDTDKQQVYDYYNKLLQDRGMSQTLFASVPSGYAVTFADERNEIQLTIEKKRADKRTQLLITFNQLHEAPAPGR